MAPTRFVAVGRDHLGVELPGERYDLPMRKLVRWRADEVGAPFPLELQIGLVATKDGLVPILGLETEFDFGRHAEFAVRGRDAATEPVEFRTGIYPRLDHAKTAHGDHLRLPPDFFGKPYFKEFQRLGRVRGGESPPFCCPPTDPEGPFENCEAPTNS
jgi:hypothetical protein